LGQCVVVVVLSLSLFYTTTNLWRKVGGACGK
jgi:hypothetical protein